MIKAGVIINKKLRNISDLLKNIEIIKNNEYTEIPPKQIMGLE
jgi:hypothetical protein